MKTKLIFALLAIAVPTLGLAESDICTKAKISGMQTKSCTTQSGLRNCSSCCVGSKKVGNTDIDASTCYATVMYSNARLNVLGSSPTAPTSCTSDTPTAISEGGAPFATLASTSYSCSSTQVKLPASVDQLVRKAGMPITINGNACKVTSLTKVTVQGTVTSSYSITSACPSIR